MLANSQVSALSKISYLPRLIPAPQALLRPARPTALPTTTAKVTGVDSGNVKDHVHHVGDMLLGQTMRPHQVRCFSVTIKQSAKSVSFMDRLLRGAPPKKVTRESVELDKIGKEGPAPPRLLVKAKATGPQTILAIIGFSEILALFIASICLGDGMSMVATICLSALSTVVGFINKWSLELPKATSNDKKGDVVIRYPNGSYLVVKCDETVARALFFAPEEIHYLITNPFIYRGLSLFGTILLMLGIVFLANAKLQLQFAWAGAYVIINIAYWLDAALPAKKHWDLDCFHHEEVPVPDNLPGNENYTKALGTAILMAGSSAWASKGAAAAAPSTDVWKAWLQEADRKAEEIKNAEKKGELPQPLWKSWDAKQAWDDLKEAQGNVV